MIIIILMGLIKKEIAPQRHWVGLILITIDFLMIYMFNGVNNIFLH